jgi:Zn-dependent protease
MHAFTAWKLGDDTAKSQGRLSLNPIRHIDLIGLIFIAVLGFGWAKPVQIDRTRFRRPVRDEILVSLAGPAANLVLAFALAALVWILIRIIGLAPSPAFEEIETFILFGMLVNLGLFIFNLIPLPPLDGSHVYLWKISRWSPELGVKVYRYGTLALLGILLVGRQLKVDILPIGAAAMWLLRGMLSVFGLGI